MNNKIEATERQLSSIGFGTVFAIQQNGLLTGRQAVVIDVGDKNNIRSFYASPLNSTMINGLMHVFLHPVSGTYLFDNIGAVLLRMTLDEVITAMKLGYLIHQPPLTWTDEHESLIRECSNKPLK